ncbi:2TM domain-containing protein [Chitinimonas naiadis]
MQTEDTLRARAERAASAKMKFFCSAASYAAIVGFLLAMNWWLEGRITWAIWPLLGLSFALAMQGVKAWGRSHAMYERLVEREMDALQRKEK